MLDCVINLEQLGTEVRKQPVFYASHEHIVYKEGQYLVFANCSEEIISRVNCPANARQYEFLDLGDALLFVFGGKDFVLFDKFGEQPISDRFDVSVWGRIITKLYPSHHKNAVIFGTKLQDKIQFINYNFINNKRISQSTSWKIHKIDDVVVKDGVLYAILDSSFLNACKVETCETLWTRFEYSIIKPKIIPYKRGLLYTCQNTLKYTEGKTSTLTKIPLVYISKLIGIRNNHLFFISNQNKNVCAYNLVDKKLVWEITGNNPILETLLAKGKSHYDIDDILLARTKDELSIVNLSRGRSTHCFKLPNVYRMRQTGDHILVHKYDQQTDMLPGIIKSD